MFVPAVSMLIVNLATKAGYSHPAGTTCIAGSGRVRRILICVDPLSEGVVFKNGEIDEFITLFAFAATLT